MVSCEAFSKNNNVFVTRPLSHHRQTLMLLNKPAVDRFSSVWILSNAEAEPWVLKQFWYLNFVQMLVISQFWGHWRPSYQTNISLLPFLPPAVTGLPPCDLQMCPVGHSTRSKNCPVTVKCELFLKTLVLKWLA